MTSFFAACVICLLIRKQLIDIGRVPPCYCVSSTQHWLASFILLSWNSFVLWRLSVETIVLGHEEDVKHHREQPQTKLCRVPKYQPPLICGETHHNQYKPHAHLLQIHYTLCSMSLNPRRWSKDFVCWDFLSLCANCVRYNNLI